MNIYHYNDFRKYLADYFVLRKKREKSFTKAKFCQLLGLPNSRSYFQDVLNGKIVSKSKIEDFVRVLELDNGEARYFRTLVKFNQATDNHQERELYFDQLVKLNKGDKKIIQDKEYAYYKDWYNPAIRAVLNVIDFKGDFKKLSTAIYPAISTGQAKGSIELLKDLGLISKNKQGFFKPTQKSLSTSEYVKDEIVRKYQIHSFELAIKALMNNQHLPQRMITRTLSVSEKGHGKLVKLVENFSRDVGDLVKKDKDPAERVHKLDVAYFPMSETKKKK